jgi:hypothetical protein
MILQLSGSDLRSLEVGENADGLALLMGDLTNHLDQFRLLFVGAVREIEASNIKSGPDKLTKYIHGA